MLERDFSLKDAYLKLFGKTPLSELNATDAHYVTSRNLAGVLRPFVVGCCKPIAGVWQQRCLSWRPSVSSMIGWRQGGQKAAPGR